MKKSLIVAMMLLILFSVFAPAEETLESGDYDYRILEDGTVEITRYSGNDEVIEVPSELDELPVTGIGDLAFGGCRSLKKITIPDSIVNIGMNPFADCPDLTVINVSQEHPYLATINGVLFSKPDRRLVCYPYAFQAKSYSIPYGIQEIGDNAFYAGVHLINVSIPDTVKSIGEYAFYNCNHLSDVLIPDSVVSIGKGAFSDCLDLTKVTLPNGITAIGEKTFSRCSSLVSISIPDSVNSIGENAFFRCEQITDVAIPNSVTSIGRRAFCYCKSLGSITIPVSVTSIGDEAFRECAEYLTVTVEEGSYAEEYCKRNGIKYQYPDALDWLKN